MYNKELHNSETTGALTDNLATIQQTVLDQSEADQTVIDVEAATNAFAEAISTNLGADAEPIPDGAIQRFDDPDKKSGNRNCWLYFDPSGMYGVYGNWGTDERYEWYLDDFDALTEEELNGILAQVEAAKQKRAEQRLTDQNEAAQKASARFNKAPPAQASHPYLKKKLIPAMNTRQEGDKLLIPLRNADDHLRNIQTITPGGKKRFQKGGEVTGNFSLIGLDKLPTEGSLIVCEGWATGVTLHQKHDWPVAAAMNAGNLGPVCEALRDKLPDTVTIIVAADDDRRTEGNPGLSKALAAGDAIGAEVIKPDFSCDDCECTDFNDVAVCQQRKENAPKDDQTDTCMPKVVNKQPTPLKDSMPPVQSLTEDMLPEGFVRYVSDVSMRLQIPGDYIAITTIGIAAGVIGGKYRIHPKQKDNWLVTPTQWAGLIGPPSRMKSACMNAASKPLLQLEDDLTRAHQDAQANYRCDMELTDSYVKEVKKEAGKIYGENRDKAIQMVRDAEFDAAPPSRQRYIVNDATVEKLGEILSENPNGLILIRDELSGLFAKLSQEEHQADRAFYLEAFEGNSSYTWDRISRGTITVPNCILSIVGGIQPSRIAPIIRSAVNGNIDDGLIQRFQLAVWPDVKDDWRWVDQSPNEAAYAQYEKVIRQLHNLPGGGTEGPSTNLRFSMPAQDAYIAWTEQVQGKIRSDELHPVMESHLAKMPKTIAGLALLFELIDGGREKVGKKATARAILWADYLTSHAERLYSLSTNQGIDSAKLILSRRGKLPEVFTARDIQRKNWTGLSEKQAVTDALECLVEHRYLSELPVPTKPSGGRPTTRYRWLPSVTKK